MKKIIVLFLLVSFYGCSEDPEQVCIEGTCYNVLSQSSSYTSNSIDILFVVDNSGSMVGEQRQLAESFNRFVSVLDERFEDYHIAVVTTGMQSGVCPPCDPPNLERSCTNETGEHGRFQDRRGWYEGTEEFPNHQYEPADPSCRVVTRDNKTCFYDEATGKGTSMVGTNGCGFEKGLAATRRALSRELLETYNAGFLRDDAMLAVVVISDEDDCGEVGDVYETIGTCYYAAKGVGPEGETVHPDDPNEKPYQLTPVEEYKDFLMKLKGDRNGMVKFTAIVGMEDVNDPASTTIEYIWNENINRWVVDNACGTPGCAGDYCFSFPGTRYIKLAQAFGLGIHGQLDTICQEDFSYTMECAAGFMACQEKFPMSKPLPASDSSILVNNTLIPKYTCSVHGQIVACLGPDDTSCQEGLCVPSWTYQTPNDSGLDGGTITFAEHLKPCDLVSDGEIMVSVITEK